MPSSQVMEGPLYEDKGQSVKLSSTVWNKMHKMVLSDPMPQVMDTSFISVSPGPRVFLMNATHSIVLYTITMHVSHAVNLVPTGIFG